MLKGPPDAFDLRGKSFDKDASLPLMSSHRRRIYRNTFEQKSHLAFQEFIDGCTAGMT
jgi:hypothetical protein